jgi:8-amino-7-oxononanoate synthase
VFEKELGELGEQGLYRSLLDRASGQGPVINLRGKKYVNFSSNDYLGLASHPAVIEAARRALEKYGFGAGASRLLAGGSMLHEELERLVARFKASGAAVILNSGHAANTGIIPALAGEADHIFSDELNHASIIDGCRLSRAKTIIYRHKDMVHLEKLIRKIRRGRKIVVTDTVFSMDGDIALIPDLYELCQRFDAMLYLDDAHGTGVLGKGNGGLAHFGLSHQPWILQMGTFSKALGSFGAFAAGGRDVIAWITNTARSLLFSTALPPCVIAASLASLRLVRKDKGMIQKLWSNRERLVTGLKEAGYEDMNTETPILPIETRSIEDAVRLSHFLYEKGFYVPAIRPPTVRKPRIRITVSSAHGEDQIGGLIELLRRWKRRQVRSGGR